MSETDKPQRQQLDDAMVKVAREIEILQSPSSIGGGSDDRQVIAELEAEYAALKDARAHLGPHET